MSLQFKLSYSEFPTISDVLNILQEAEVAGPPGTSHVNGTINEDTIDPALRLLTSTGEAISRPLEGVVLPEEHISGRNQPLVAGNDIPGDIGLAYDMNVDSNGRPLHYHEHADKTGCIACIQPPSQTVPPPPTPTPGYGSFQCIGDRPSNSTGGPCNTAIVSGADFDEQSMNAKMRVNYDWSESSHSPGHPVIVLPRGGVTFAVAKKGAKRSEVLTRHDPGVLKIEQYLRSNPFLWEAVVAVLDSLWYRRRKMEEPLSARFRPPKAPMGGHEGSPFRIFITEGPEYRCLLCSCRRKRLLGRALGHAREHFGYRPFDGATCQNTRNDVSRRNVKNKDLTCPECKCPLTLQNKARHVKTTKHLEAVRAAAERDAASSATTTDVPVPDDLVSE
ncbi:hypothetical protein FRC14_001479 [Serendipita sp. 396]|nr:hypothetical protein FRC14_001479 [Serendipita sp. 396]KAG8772874.1 hypothetical protein FRC15_002427 [Serendipita sp. 397]KAG8781758.1 hypothetical protein FRC16_002789 [Serendipita sp. 398]KAG8853858.1 hypothetical protein FRC20_001154 [Serendipita sp. 405]